jgi:hypothetical protein
MKSAIAQIFQSAAVTLAGSQVAGWAKALCSSETLELILSFFN